MTGVITFFKKNKLYFCITALEMVFLVFLLVVCVGKRNDIIIPGEELSSTDYRAAVKDGIMCITQDEEHREAQYVIQYENISLPFGRYDLIVDYSASGDEGIGAYGVIDSSSALKDSRYRTAEGIFLAKQGAVVAPVWCYALTGVRDAQLRMRYFGYGDLQIKSFIFREDVSFRVAYLIGALFLLLLLNGLCYYFFVPNRYQNKTVTAGLIFTVFFSSLLAFTDKVYAGHDILFHLNRIVSIAEGIQAGNWNVKIYSGMLEGYGYAAPLYYPHLFLYIPAIMYSMGVQLTISYNIYLVLVNTATCLVSYFCCDRVIKDKKIAMIGSFLYTTAAYRIVSLHVRTAMGEYTAMIFLPLLIYGFYKLYTSEKGAKFGLFDCMPVILGLTGMIQSHILTCEMAAFFIVIFCLIRFKKTFQPRRLAALAASAGAVLVLNAGFIIPLLTSFGSGVCIESAENNVIQKYGVSFSQMFNVLYNYSGGANELSTNSAISPTVGFALVIGLAVFGYCYVYQERLAVTDKKEMKAGKICFWFSLVCILFSTRYFPWDSICAMNGFMGKIFGAIQYPWRYLGLAAAFAMYAAVIGLKIIKEKHSASICRNCMIVMASFAAIASGYFFANYSNIAGELNIIDTASLDRFYIVYGEYLLKGTDVLAMHDQSVLCSSESVVVSQYERGDGEAELYCVNTSQQQETTVSLPIHGYDYYCVYLESGEELLTFRGENNRLSFHVPAGYAGSIRVVYEGRKLWDLSAAVSLGAAVLLAGCCVTVKVHKRKKYVSGH